MLNSRIFILFSFFSSCLSSCGRSYQQSILWNKRIIGGITAQKHAWPWIVSIHRMDINDPDAAFCGGSLINEKYVLTAAHCFSNLNHALISNYFIVIGSDYINDSNRFKIKSIRLHENYDDNLYLNDIALLELAYKVNSNTDFICLPPKNRSIYPDEQMKGIVAGWGSLKENSSMSYTLQQIELPIISNKDQFCIQQISDEITQFCAGFTQGGKDACQGDSGGPLMIYDRSICAWHIAGIISYGYGCARPENPGVYTRVSMFVDWIDEHINSSSIMQMSLKILLLLFFTVMYFEKSICF